MFKDYYYYSTDNPTISITTEDGTTSEISVDFEYDNETVVFDSKHLIIDQIRGPWFSLGFHADFQGRFLELHVGWWVFTIGRPYHKRND